LKTFSFIKDLQSHSAKNLYQIAEVNEEIRCYKATCGAILKQPNSVRSIFDPLLWWKEQRYSFPIMSQVAKMIFIISTSSAESEQHLVALAALLGKIATD